MSFPHPSHPDRSNRADHPFQAGAGTAAVALGHWIVEGTAAAAIALGGRIHDGVLRWRRRRDAINELATLDERMLRDIGLRRADIPFVVDELLNAPSLRATSETGGPRIAPRHAAPAPLGCG